MKAQAPTDFFIASIITPERRAEAHAWINDYAAKLKANRQRQHRQAVAQNELESGEIKDG